MNRKYNLKLDLQFRCNNSTMKFNQFDNNTSDFFMRITNGGNLVDIEKAIVVLAIIKPSGKVASQFVEVENGLVYADLKPNMRDEIGIYTAQAMLILEDERVVTDSISYEVEEDKIFSLLNDTVETAEDFTLLTDMLNRLSTIEISEEQRVINEAERILSEENRKIEEAKRVEAELIRQHEEADRAKYDATRESNENIRKINEEARISSENVRLENEANRIEQEANRVKAEQLRKDNYNLMTEDEERRRSEANAHKEAEKLRAQAENTRVNEEAKRRTTEQARVSAENTRVSNENTRKANEITRQNNETQRVEAETQRQNRYNSFIADAEANANNFENYTNTAKIKEEERKSNELNRKSQEDRRVSNEVERISNENTRKANENARIESEKQRVDAENLRKEKIVEIQSDYDSLKKVIIDENASANLQNQINQTNSQLEHKVNKGGVSVLDIDKNKGKLDQTYMSKEFLQQIVGNAPVSTIPSVGSITDEMFARPYAYGEIGKNLFNKNACEIGKYVGDNGQLGDNVDYCASHFIQVHPTKSYFLSITESWGFQFCYYDANKEFLSIDSTKGGVFTIPDNCYFVRFTFKPIDLNTIQFEEGTEQTQYEEFKVNLLAKSVHCNSLNDDVIDLISKSNYRITCKRNDNELVVGFKYNSNEDMRILFKPCGQNLLTQINNIYKFENKNIIPSLDFSKYGTIFQEATTDWIGPYIVRTSNNDGDMPNSWHFTSGWHGFNGDQTGSKTARNVSAKFYIDNVEIVDNNVKCGNEIKIIVVNNIQSTDTKKQDGSGRECLQETVTYTITPNNVDVDVEIKALENVKITTYYGLQTSNHSYDCEILYTDDETMKNWTNCENVKIDGGTKLNSECCEYKIRKNNDLLVAWIDNGYGLGKRKYVNEDKPIVWTADYSKSYMVLVNGNLDLITNEVLYWRGGYKFISLI